MSCKPQPYFSFGDIFRSYRLSSQSYYRVATHMEKRIKSGKIFVTKKSGKFMKNSLKSGGNKIDLAHVLKMPKIIQYINM